MYCKKAMEDMKAWKASATFHDDKCLLKLLDNKLVDILGINGAYYMDFPTAKQLVYKLSSPTFHDKLCTGLDTVKDKQRDIHHTQNYIQTFKELFNIARVKTDEELDTIPLNMYSTSYDERDDKCRGFRSNREKGRGGRNNVQINITGFNGSYQGGKGGNN